MDRTIQVDETYFQHDQDRIELLHSFRNRSGVNCKVRDTPVEDVSNRDIPQREVPYCTCDPRCDSSKLIEQLDKALAPLKAKYVSVPENTTRETRKKWRDERIKLYDNLLLLALDAEGHDWEKWFKDKSATDFCAKEIYYKLKPESVYTYLVDQVHEDEEIMFKFYRAKNGSAEKDLWRLDVLWLVQSIGAYREYFTYAVLVQLEPTWDDKNEKLCTCLLTEAQTVFEETFSTLHSRRFKTERNWRSRARLYWLLGLIRHALVFRGSTWKFKNLAYNRPVHLLLEKMIKEDTDMLDEKPTDEPADKPTASKLLQFCKPKYDKVKKQVYLGHLKVDRLLAWASAANDLDLVRIVLEHYRNCMTFGPEDPKWEKSMRESWATALWNASYKGHAEIVKELLSCTFPYHLYYSEYISGKEMESPLHIAVQRRHTSVVDVFCTTASLYFNCHEESFYKHTPLEVATGLKDSDPRDAATVRTIQSLLLQRPEVKNAMEEWIKQRQLAMDSANAIMVGGTLIAGITFAGWLQPPLGYNSYYQFVESTPAAPPDAYESYMSIQGHAIIQVFAIFNSLSFFLAIAAIIAGMETICFIQAIKVSYMREALKRLEFKFIQMICIIIASILCVLVAFASAGIAILPPIKRYQISMYVTIAIGGFICVVLLCKIMAIYVPESCKIRRKSQFDDFSSN